MDYNPTHRPTVVTVLGGALAVLSGIGGVLTCAGMTISGSEGSAAELALVPAAFGVMAFGVLNGRGWARTRTVAAAVHGSPWPGVARVGGRHQHAAVGCLGDRLVRHGTTIRTYPRVVGIAGLACGD